MGYSELMTGRIDGRIINWIDIGSAFNNANVRNMHLLN